MEELREPSRLINQKRFSLVEAAKILGVGQTKFRQLVAIGKIAYYEIGGRKVFSEASLEEFLHNAYVPVEKENHTPVDVTQRQEKPRRVVKGLKRDYLI